MSAPILRGQLIRSNRATALNITVTGYSPMLELSRRLIGAGVDPATPFYAYRGDILCIAVRSIGEAARLRVATHGVGFEPLPECTRGPPVRPKRPAGVRQRASLRRAPAEAAS
jgi:hypothetical protein